MNTVKVTVSQETGSFHFRGKNIHGHIVDMDDAGAYESGNGSGASPMEVLIMAIGGCSGLDIVAILTKGKQTIDRFDMEVTGEKPAGVAPSIYHRIHVLFRFEGQMDEIKVRRAIDLSLGKYCSVARTLEKTAEISYDFQLNGEFISGSTLELPA